MMNFEICKITFDVCRQKKLVWNRDGIGTVPVPIPVPVPKIPVPNLNKTRYQISYQIFRYGTGTSTGTGTGIFGTVPAWYHFVFIYFLSSCTSTK
ncbi:hypothetical protein HanPI659440_Chr00c10g0722871 [Helianthus annuus]|nr:hypothetical protein HanPI659440_Chr00c10g0722871 [Helianthus annuus]